jgi:hypothetical protein
VQVWGGPLSGGRYVIGLLNRGAANATITAPFSVIGAPGVGPGSTFCVRDAWMQVSAAPVLLVLTVPSAWPTGRAVPVPHGSASGSASRHCRKRLELGVGTVTPSQTLTLLTGSLSLSLKLPVCQ